MANRLLSILASIACVGATAAYAGGAELFTNDEGQINFITPTGNIGCTFTPKGGTTVYEPVDGGPELQCSRVEPSYVTVILGPKGAAKKITNPGEQGCCSLDQKLEYGQSWSRDSFTCTSKTTGLSCKSTNGHGFSMSKAKVTVY